MAARNISHDGLKFYLHYIEYSWGKVQRRPQLRIGRKKNSSEPLVKKKKIVNNEKQHIDMTCEFDFFPQIFTKKMTIVYSDHEVT